ncbi:hypothetical protein MNBD_NITROSPIRAE01-489 [hydrothermal vent metagenome]|uniref:Antitoxin n=1 Tax=hydrothermal vent metagenome TaxID=652676 RepID=A0A3B1DLX0_9ZZZZ|nr:type II toxin-antitoxin system prevent-host-death family antitoxin [Candidatus Manganitrophaceae bacterium]
MEIAAGEFKAKCLKLMDDVQKYHEDIIITKHGKPVARLTAIEETTPRPLFGFLKDTLILKGDIVNPLEEKWSADDDE